MYIVYVQCIYFSEWQNFATRQCCMSYGRRKDGYKITVFKFWPFLGW